MTNLDKNDSGTGQTLPDLDTSPIPLLEKVRNEGRVWDDLCEQYGVDNPNPSDADRVEDQIATEA